MSDNKHEKPEPSLPPTSCSALLDLFLGWAMLQVVRRNRGLRLESGDFGPHGDSMIVLNGDKNGLSAYAKSEGLTDRILSLYQPTLEQELKNYREGRQDPVFGWDDLPRAALLFQSPLVAEFLGHVETAIRHRSHEPGFGPVGIPLEGLSEGGSSQEQCSGTLDGEVDFAERQG